METLRRVNDESRLRFFLKGTVVFLLATSAASFYEAFFLVSNANSFSFAILLVGGISRLIVAAYCWRGAEGVFRVAAGVAAISVLIELSLAGANALATILYVAPQILVIVFSLLTLRQKRIVESE